MYQTGVYKGENAGAFSRAVTDKFRSLEMLIRLALRIPKTSYWARRRLKSPWLFNRIFKMQIKEKNQSSVSLAFVRGIHRWPVTRKMFPFDDVIMEWYHGLLLLTEINENSNEVSTWINNYVHVKWWTVIAHPCPIFNISLVKQSLKVDHRLVITT